MGGRFTETGCGKKHHCCGEIGEVTLRFSLIRKTDLRHVQDVAVETGSRCH
ncbi:hypothetical protein SynA1528_00879 [Synechococcus sp. A15-28]|nr:hypothetical protein SynA1528_00879 [Synechococcus sp. A15-28]